MRDVLVVKIASRGDLLMSGPAIRALRERHPDARISLLVGKSCEDVGRRLTAIDDVILIDDQLLFANGLIRRARGAATMLAAMTRWRRHASPGPCSVVILHRDWRYAAVARMAGIPFRFGFGGPLASRLLTDPYLPGLRDHHVSDYLGVAGVDNDAGIPATSRLRGTWGLKAGEREVALAKAGRLGFTRLPGDIALGFGGGRNVKTRTGLKCWPVERYRELARSLHASGRRVVWLGDDHDASVLGDVDVGVNLAGRLTVPETAAVLGECDAVVANDTLVMHLGGAMGIPAVGVFGPTDPEHTGPLGDGSVRIWAGADLPCSPCHRDGFFPECPFEHRCMQRIGVAEVLHQVLALADENESAEQPPRKAFQR